MKENTSYAYRKFEKLCKEEGIVPYQVTLLSNGQIASSSLAQWKKGAYELKLDKLKIIASILGVPVTEFIEDN